LIEKERNTGRVRRKRKKEKRASEPSLVLPEHATDLTGEVNDVRELFEPHEVVDLDGRRLADSVDVVSGEVDEHDVFGSVLWRGEQAGSESSVLYITWTTRAHGETQGGESQGKDRIGQDRTSEQPKREKRRKNDEPSGVLPLLTVPAIAWL
jgi:hypothetical protein